MRVFLSGLLSLVAGNFLALILNFIFAIILLQRLSAADYGLQSTLVAFSAIAISFSDLGLFDFSLRELARQPREALRDTFSSLLTLRLLLACVVCLVAFAVALLANSFRGPQVVILLLALFTLVLSFAPTAMIEALLGATGRTQRIALLQGIYSVGTVIVGVALLAAGADLTALYLAFAILSTVVILLYLVEARRVLPEGFGLRWQPRKWSAALRQSLPGGLGGACLTFCLRFSTYLVYTFVSQAGAGYIGVSSQLYQAMIVLIWSPFAISILPVLSRLHSQSEARLKWLSGRSLTWLLAAVLPLTVGGVLLARELLDVLKPGSGVIIAPTMQILLWVLPLDILQGFLYRILLVLGWQRTYLQAAGAGVIVNIALCIVLIPAFGVQGAVAATVGSVAAIVALCAWRLRRWILPTLRFADSVRLLIALGGMSLAVLSAREWWFGGRIAVGGVVYLALLFGSRLFTRADWRATRALVQPESA